MADATEESSSSVAVQLRQAEAAIREQLGPVLAEHDLAMEHWRIIAVIDDQPGRTMSSVAAAAVVPAATLTRHMDRLVERGLVVRHVDAADKRRVAVALSPQGRLLAQRLRDLEQRATHPARQDPLARVRHLSGLA